MARAPRRPRSRSSLVLRWIALAVLALIAISYVAPLRAYLKTRDEVGARKKEVAARERRNGELAARVEYARTVDFVEHEARKLGLVRPGERLFIVRRPGP